MRIGDRIAIMQGGQIIQVGTPHQILDDPADDYVRSFFRGVNVSSVLSAAHVASLEKVIGQDGGLASVLAELQADDGLYGYVVGPDKQFRGVVSEASVRQAMASGSSQLADAFLDDIECLPAAMPLGDVVGKVAQARCGLPVVSGQGCYLGAITKTALLQTLDRADG
jgi:glycine betaine/proline transport system ATP-binding protein